MRQPVSQTPSFVVIDYHAESRYLLVKTLRRKFPHAVIHESDDAEKAIEIARAVNLAAIITHRTYQMEGAELVRRLREADPKVPIVMVSGIDRSAAARAAGANAFLHYDEWLRVGSVVEAHLRLAGDAPASDETAVA
jgi:DNA-binding NarL/FixJ family response regulator